MEMKQKMELRKLMAPELRQSLNILALNTLDLNQLAEEELTTNPLLEETGFQSLSQSLPEKGLVETPVSPADNKEELFGESPVHESKSESSDPDIEFITSMVVQKTSLHEALLRQLGMFTNTDEELLIGQEIIGNIDDNGYLKSSLEEISSKLAVPLDKIEKTLKLIQKFEPYGVAARTPAECLLIQVKLTGEKDPALEYIIEHHLEDIARKNHTAIAKALKQPLEAIEPLIKKIQKLNPKPGRNFSQDIAQRVIPDAMIEEKNNTLELIINNEYIPRLTINKTYLDMLKQDNLDQQTREFLTQKLKKAQELLKAMSKRQSTLRRVINAIIEVQKDAIKEDLSTIKPLTFQEIADKLQLHESTICRVVMNKYIKTPCGVIALKSFFSNKIQSDTGESLSSTCVKGLIKELVEQENKKKPLSDQEISQILAREKNLKLARRTVAKYREELKILSTTYRRVR